MSAPSQEPLSASEQARWFDQEVHPHGTSLKTYLRSSFPTVRDVDDVVQESYIRILKARATQPLHSVRAFLFSVARRLAIDAIRRNKRTALREVVMDSESADALEDKANTAEAVCIDEEFTLLAEAIHSLPTRCREIMILRKLHCLSQKGIAEKLGISVSTVEVQLLRGMKKCAEYLRHKGMIDRRNTP